MSDRPAPERGSVDELLKDPAWRQQYDVAPHPDPEFEHALGEGPVLRMVPVSTPLTIIQPWLAPLHKK